jgi:hypothetical protein
MWLNDNDNVPPPSPLPIDPNDAPGAMVPNDDDAPLLLFFFLLLGCLQMTMMAREEQECGWSKQSRGRQLHYPLLHSHILQNVVARSASSLPHHNALAAVGEGNEGSRTAGSLLFFSLVRHEREEFTPSDNCYILCKESSCPEF